MGVHINPNKSKHLQVAPGSLSRRGVVHRPRVVTGYLRPKPKVYAYLRPKPKVYAYLRPMPAAPRVYDVAYPYGVGGDTLLDRVSVDFDSWVTSALIGYFFNRFVATPFGIPSVTGLLSQVLPRNIKKNKHSMRPTNTFSGSDSSDREGGAGRGRCIETFNTA